MQKLQQKTILTQEKPFHWVYWIMHMCVHTIGRFQQTLSPFSFKASNHLFFCKLFTLLLNYHHLLHQELNLVHSLRPLHTDTLKRFTGAKQNKYSLLLMINTSVTIQYLLLISGLVSGTTGLCGWTHLERLISWLLRLWENTTTPNKWGQRVGMAHQNNSLNQFCQGPPSLCTRTN